MAAAPAIAGVEPPPAPAPADDDASGDAGDDAADAADAPAARETPDATTAPPASGEATVAADAAPSAPGSHPGDSQPPDQRPADESAEATPPVAAAPAAVPPADATAAHAAAAPAPPSRAAAPGAALDVSAHAAPATGATDAPRIGAGLDIGLPDGATASIVVRPVRSIRAHAGVSHNAISLGERVGLTWVPLSWWVSPTLSLEYGHYADGNANPLVRMVSGDQSFSSAVLDRVGYDYANAHAGLEIGRRWFTFYIHAGYSRVTGTVHNLSAETMSESSGTTSVTFSKDPSVRLWSVSARLGFIVYLAK